MNIDKINSFSKVIFVKTFGNIYEHSSWIAEKVFELKPFNNLDELYLCFKKILKNSDLQKKINLILAHPDLAGKLAINNKLTKESTREQKSLNLNNLDEKNFTKLNALNKIYKEKFGFPFIICVLNQKSVQDIIANMELRINHSKENEIQNALKEINQIAKHRINQIFNT